MLKSPDRDSRSPWMQEADAGSSALSDLVPSKSDRGVDGHFSIAKKQNRGERSPGVLQVPQDQEWTAPGLDRHVSSKPGALQSRRRC